MMERKLTPGEKVKIYFKSTPFIFGEALFFIGLVVFFSEMGKATSLIGFAMLGIGGFLIKRRYSIVQKGNDLVENGNQTTAQLVDISDTLFRHNQRTIKKYTFEYVVKGEKQSFVKKSAYLRKLKLDEKVVIFYSEKQPEDTFVPFFYGIRKYEELKSTES